MMTKITQVPTTIVTGFLGTGKTSTIQHLLKHKPDNERWAILVNEFGTVGIDGTLYQNTHEEQGGIFVREVPGGCMCCISGLPMQIALNVLLKLSNPHRLFIELSGLGHPVEVLALLKSQYYQEVIDIQKIITLIDPQQFLQSKYRNHETYKQQLAIADAIVVNKKDKCSRDQLTVIEAEIKQSHEKPVACYFTEHGKLDWSLLVGKTESQVSDDVIIRAVDDVDDLPEDTEIPKQTGFIKTKRSGEGYHGISWRYEVNYIFDHEKLLHWIKGIQVERVKGVFNTNSGVIGINAQHGHVQSSIFDSCNESRIEIITESVDPAWDEHLASCIIGNKVAS